MSLEARLLAAVVLSAAAAFALTPIAIRAAAYFDFYDKPKGYKGHAAATPYLGGSAVMAAFVVVLLLLAGDYGRTGPLALGVAVLWAVGTIDDRRNVSPGLRVLVELALAVMLWASDLGWDLGLGGGVDLAATVFWVIAVVNAFNLFDNMDGASSSMALVVSAGVAILGVVDGDPWLTAAGAALAGACLGFLPHNLARPNARIFLGDGGSMPVGFAIAALVMTGASGSATQWQALVLGLLLVGVPALDTALVIVSRRRKGISVLTGGRDHLTHRTRRRLGDARAVAMTLGAMQAIVALLALIAADGGSMAVIVLTVTFLAVAGGLIAVLEREEDRLVAAGRVQVPEDAVEKAQRKREQRPNPPTVGDLALVAVAAGAGSSALFFGFYDSRVWVPLGVGVVALAAMGAIRRPPALVPRGRLVLVGLVGLGLWALVSAGWAESADQAVVDGNRWLVLAAVFGLALVLMRSARRDVLALGGLTAGVLVVAGVVVVRMLGDDGADVFLGGRLHEPLGYINAEATVFLMGLWLCFAGAERREWWLAGPAMGAATLLACLTLLSQSRGAAIAAIVSAIVVLAALPGRQRRAFGLIALGGGLALALGPLLDVYDAAQAAAGMRPPVDVVQDAASAALLVAFGAGLLWAGAVFLYERALAPSGRSGLVTAGRAALAVGIVATLAVGIASADRIGSTVDRQWTAFTHLSEPTGSVVPEADVGSRLVSGAGNRYDYWRVAWDAFKDNPVRGLGAGNFDRAWFASRTTSEDVRQAHSIELQVLSDMGVVGAGLLMLVLAGLAIALVRFGSVARPGTAASTVGVAGIGVTVAWLVHTSVDWQHLLPGVTAMALIMLATLVRRRAEIDRGAARVSFVATAPRLAVTGMIALVVVVAGASLTRQGLADHYRAAAFDAIAEDPSKAIAEADRSLRLNGDAVRTYYAKAAALARLDRGEQAENVLLEATRREPSESVTWALLGDLATRRGLEDDANRYYRQALDLNPRDPGLQQLVQEGA